LLLPAIIAGASCGDKPFFQEDKTWFQSESTPPPSEAERYPTDVPTLIRDLVSKTGSLRLNAARTLGSSGLDARSALPALLLVAKDDTEDVEIRTAAIESVSAIGPWDENVVPSLAWLLKDRETRIRIATTRSLARLETSAAPATDALIEALRDEEVRTDAIRALAGIGAQAVSSLMKATRDKNDGVRKAAYEALVKIGAPSVDPIIDSLKAGKVDYDYAMNALAKIGAPAVESLVKHLGGKNDSMRRLSAETLRRIGPPAKSAVPALAKTANDPLPTVRASALAALAAIGPAGETETKAILWGLRDRDARVRSAASGAARKIGPDADAGAVSVLAEALKDRRWFVCTEAADALGRIGPNASASVPDLIKALSAKDSKIRYSAARALGAVGPKAAEALPELERLLKDPDPSVRTAATRSIEKIKE
jgi:HEAT repeat protein